MAEVFMADGGGVAPARVAWSEALGAEIVRRTAAGETLRQVCAGAGMPAVRTVVKWSAQRAAFGAAMAEARAAAGRGLGYGPPRAWCAETAELVFQRLCDGESMAAIGRDVDMPARSTLYRWVHDEPEFREAVGLAREIQADVLADRALAVAEEVTPATARACEVRLRHMRWHIGKVSPRKYGSLRASEPAQAPLAVVGAVVGAGAGSGGEDPETGVSRITLRHYWMEVRDDGWRRMRASYIDPDLGGPVDEPPGDWRAPPTGWRPPAEREELLGGHWLVNQGAGAGRAPGEARPGEDWTR